MAATDGKQAGKEGADRSARLDAADQQTLLDQREANLQLVLATIQAQELTEAAQASQARAEALAEKLKATERELRATAEFREKLLGMVGHDLRHPLSAISMGAQLLVSRGRLVDDDARLVGRLINNVQRMDAMIGQIFAFTHARLGGGVPLTLAHTDLQQVCQQTVGELALGSSVPIHCEFVGDLTGTWDAERLTQVITNLVVNAIEHAAPGSPVLVRACGDGKEVVVEVRNHGEPIPAALLPVLFEPFHHASQGQKSRVGHLGLGLYISREIAAAHGGTLTARSADGVTSFAIRLPVESPGDVS